MMISGKSLFRTAPIQIEVTATGPLWVDQPLAVRLIVHKTPQSLHSSEVLQSAWASSLPYLSASYTVTCDGHTVPINHGTQHSTQLNNPNIILSVSDEEKEKYLLSLVYETTISVERQFFDKRLQLEVQLMYSNSEEGDAHQEGNKNAFMTSDMERNIRTLMDLNRQGKSLDTMAYRSFHAPDRAVIRQVTGQFTLSHPLQVEMRCRELSPDSSLISIHFQNKAQCHVIALHKIECHLRSSSLDLERMWERILSLHKAFVQKLKGSIHDAIASSSAAALLSDEHVWASAPWLKADFVNNPSAMYVEEALDSYSSVDGTSTIAPTQAPSVFRHHHHHHVNGTAHGSSNNSLDLALNQPLLALAGPPALDTPRSLSIPDFQVTCLSHLNHFELAPGEGKALVYRVDRTAPTEGLPPSLDQLLTSFFPFLSTMLNIAWQPLFATTANRDHDNAVGQDKFCVAISQHRLHWSLGAQCLVQVYHDFFNSLYPIAAHIHSKHELLALSPAFEPRFHTEILHKLHKLFLYGPTASAFAAPTTQPSTPLLSKVQSIFAQLNQPAALVLQVEGPVLIGSRVNAHERQADGSIRLVVYNPHADKWLRDVVIYTDASLLSSETDDGDENDSTDGTSTAPSCLRKSHASQSVFSFHPAILSIGYVPLECCDAMQLPVYSSGAF